MLGVGRRFALHLKDVTHQTNLIMKRILTISAMVIMALGMWAQSMTVTGVVMAQDEPDPVIGANVMVKGTTVGTITDFDGNFELQAKVGDVLQVSFMGLRK